MLAIEGIPIFYLELAIGQRLRKGAIGVWNQVSPYLGGIGISSAVVSFNVALYYNTIIAWCLFYFVQASSDRFTFSRSRVNVETIINHSLTELPVGTTVGRVSQQILPERILRARARVSGE